MVRDCFGRLPLGVFVNCNGIQVDTIYTQMKEEYGIVVDVTNLMTIMTRTMTTNDHHRHHDGERKRIIATSTPTTLEVGEAMMKCLSSLLNKVIMMGAPCSFIEVMLSLMPIPPLPPSIQHLPSSLTMMNDDSNNNDQGEDIIVTMTTTTPAVATITTSNTRNIFELKEVNTGLQPFMIAAVLQDCKLELVYMLINGCSDSLGRG